MTLKLTTAPAAWGNLRMLADIAYKSLYAEYEKITADPAYEVTQELHDLALDWQTKADDYLGELNETPYEDPGGNLYDRFIVIINAVVDAPIET